MTNNQSNKVGSIVVGVEPNCLSVADADALVDRNYESIYRYAYRLTACQATAEDITQDAFMQAIAHLDQLRSAEAERGWLLAIVRSQFMRFLRKTVHGKHGRTVSLDAPFVLPPGQTGPEMALATPSAIEGVENRDWVQTALDALGQDVRVALLMYYFEELSYAEIASQLQIPIGTVMSRLSRGRQQLRQALEASGHLDAADPEAQSAPANQGAAVTDLRALSSSSGAAVGGLVLNSHLPSKPLAQEAKHG